MKKSVKNSLLGIAAALVVLVAVVAVLSVNDSQIAPAQFFSSGSGPAVSRIIP